MSATKDTLVLLSPTGEELDSLAEAWEGTPEQVQELGDTLGATWEGTPEQVKFVTDRLDAYARRYAKAHTTGTGRPVNVATCASCLAKHGPVIDNSEFLASLVAANNYATCLLFYATELLEELSDEAIEAIEAIWNDEGPTDAQRELAATEIEKLIRDLLYYFAGFDDPEAEDEL